MYFGRLMCFNLPKLMKFFLQEPCKTAANLLVLVITAFVQGIHLEVVIDFCQQPICSSAFILKVPYYEKHVSSGLTLTLTLHIYTGPP